MIVQEKTREINSTMGNQQAFNIKASSKAFRILSDGIYSNKIRAVIRELSCNALDSHRAADKATVPFKVQMPNDLQPYFSVQDFGIGLSVEQVMHIYTTYFESTKTDSNDYTGALGLGSKSPFSYVDSFTVVSNYKGFKHSFVCYMDESDAPAISHVGSVATDECNGVTVQMPVAPKDFRKFIIEGASVYKFFDVMPEVIGCNADSYKTIEVEREITPFVHMCDYEGTTVIAIQGDVSYPVKTELLDQDALTFTQFMNHKTIILRAEIGDLDFAASREELSYDVRTIDKLNSLLKDANKVFIKDIIDEVQQEPTLQLAKKKLEDVVSGISSYRTKSLAKQLQVPFQGHLLDLEPFTLNELVLDDISEDLRFSFFESKYGRTAQRRIEKFQYTNNVTVGFRFDCIISIDDKSRFGAKIHNYIQGSPFSSVPVINHVSDEADKKVSEMLGGMPIVKSSTLSIPAHVLLAIKEKRKPVKILGMIRGGWREADVDFNKGGVYVDVCRDEIIDSKVSRDLIRGVQEYKGTKVFGVRTAQLQKKFAKSPNWIKLGEHLKTVEICKSTMGLYTIVASKPTYLIENMHKIAEVAPEFKKTMKPLVDLCNMLDSRNAGRKRIEEKNPSKAKFYRAMSDYQEIESIYNLIAMYKGLTKDQEILKLVDMESYWGLDDEKIQILAKYLK